MPDTVQFHNGNHIINYYAADGRKMGTRYFTLTNPVVVPMGETRQWQFEDMVVDETATYYADNFEYVLYKDPDPDTQFDLISLTRIHNVEGYISNLPNSGLSVQPTYCYYRKDHLGNNREVWQAPHVLKNGTTVPASTIQRTQYYPSGLPFGSLIDNNPERQPYKYNGKEFITMHGYDIYDYGMRGYYAAIMRFTTPDPLAEKYYSVSPYAYCGNNPVNRIDPTGMDWNITQSTDTLGNIHYAMTVNGVLYNNSSNSSINMADLLNAIVNQVNSAYTFSGNGFSVSMNLNLRIVTSVDDIKKTDHVFQVVNQNDLPTKNTIGMANKDGLNIRLSEQHTANIINGNNIRTSAHELGHTGGLYDVNVRNNLGVQSDLTNLMTQTKYIQENNGNPSLATNLEESQIGAIYSSYVRGGLNKYSPVSRRISGLTAEPTRSSAGTMPLLRFTYKNILKK